MNTLLRPQPGEPTIDKVRRAAFGGVVLVALALVAWAVSTKAGAASVPDVATQSASALAAATTHQVVYGLTTSGAATTADITYKTPTGIEQQQGVDVPLMSAGGGAGITLTQVASGQFLSISGQLKGDAQDITCSITVDGTVVAQNTSSGEFAIASCDATA
jgi:hypothetical protein